MYYVAVYDNNQLNVKNISETVKTALMEHRVKKMSIMHISDLQHLNLSPFKILDCHILAVSLEMPNALDFACQVSGKNPFCKVIFYGETNAEPNRLFCCRPAALLKNAYDNETFGMWLKQEFEGFSHTVDSIFLETKNAQIIMSVRGIVYFSSEGHYINAVAVKSRLNERFKYTLDNLQSRVSECVFVRIHKSYLASLLHVTKLDKKQHVLIMDNGDRLPISDYYYKEVTKKIRQFCPLEL